MCPAPIKHRRSRAHDRVSFNVQETSHPAPIDPGAWRMPPMIDAASAIARATDFVVQVELGKTHAAIAAHLQWHCTERLNFEI
jgi:hypothetical protein